MTPSNWQKLKIALSLAALAAAAIWAAFRPHNFSVRLVSFEFVPAKYGTSVPGSERYPGEDALAVRFESDMNLMLLAEIRSIQFRCEIDGSQSSDRRLGGYVFPDMADPRWHDDNKSERLAGRPRRYMARVRLWPSYDMPNRSTYYRDHLLAGHYDGLRCQVVGSAMVSSMYYSSEMRVTSDLVKRAVAEALAK